MAKDAEGDIDVAQFRSNHLPDGLIEAIDIHDSVTSLYRDHLPVGWRIDEPELTDAAWRRANNAARFGKPRLRFSLAFWMEPGNDGWVASRWPVPVRSPLAEFGKLSLRSDPDAPWDEDRRRWNEKIGGEHPDWRHEDVSNFRRHAKDAARRLLYVGIESP